MESTEIYLTTVHGRESSINAQPRRLLASSSGKVLGN